MPIAFHFAARSHVGMVRSNNQDSGYAGPHLLVVADGMGGHAGGDLASAIAIADLFDLDDDAHGGFETTQVLSRAIAEANLEIARAIEDNDRLHGMGTTVTAVLRSRNSLAIAHIGDSRGYLLRDGRLTQITADHSFVQTLIDEGRITEEEAATHPQRSLVTRVLTGHVGDNPDLSVREIKEGDRLLLCSDGLSGFVAHDTIAEVVLEGRDPAATADRLVDLALKAGAPDNVTVVLADAVNGPETNPPTQPQIVGSAAVHTGSGTKPIPLSPAAKAAALTAAAKQAAAEKLAPATPGADEPSRTPGSVVGSGAAGRTGGDPTPGTEASSGSSDGAGGDAERLRLAEEGGERSRAASWVRGVAVAVVAAIVLGAAATLGYGWTQRQYYVGEHQGYVAIYRGVPFDLGPITLSTATNISDVAVSDLPAFYADRLAQNVSFDSAAAANGLLADLRTAAFECAGLRAQGRPCGTGEADGSDATTPSPTPNEVTSPTEQLSEATPGAGEPSSALQPVPDPAST